MRFAKIIFVFLCVFLLGGCIQQKTDEDVLKKNIGELLAKYQQGVNDLDRGLLETVISDKFSFYETGRAEYIEGLLHMTMLIDRMAYSNIRVENYKIFADVQTEGSIIYKPEVRIPLFPNIPFMNGKVREHAVFAFLYEEAEGLKILAEDKILAEKEITWGTHQPGILKPQLSQYQAAPGDQVEVSFQVNKSNNDVTFVFVNDQMLSGYSLDGYAGDGVDYSLKIPAGVKRGENYEVKMMVFGGKVDLNNPAQAVLQGAAIKTYLLPVR